MTPLKITAYTKNKSQVAEIRSFMKSLNIDFDISGDDFVGIQDGKEAKPTKAQVLQGIEESIAEVKLMVAGKLKAKSLSDLLNEL